MLHPGRGDSHYKRDRNACQNICIKPLKVINLGVAQAFYDLHRYHFMPDRARLPTHRLFTVPYFSVKS